MSTFFFKCPKNAECRKNEYTFEAEKINISAAQSQNLLKYYVAI